MGCVLAVLTIPYHMYVYFTLDPRAGGACAAAAGCRGAMSGPFSRRAVLGGAKAKGPSKSPKLPEVLLQPVDTRRVNLEVVRQWVVGKITELLGGVEDEVLCGLVMNLLEEPRPSGAHVHATLITFLEKHTSAFLEELWGMLAGAQHEPSGVPPQLLAAQRKEQEAREEAQRRYAAIQSQQAAEQERRVAQALAAAQQGNALLSSLHERRPPPPPQPPPVAEPGRRSRSPERHDRRERYEPPRRRRSRSRERYEPARRRRSRSRSRSRDSFGRAIRKSRSPSRSPRRRSRSPRRRSRSPRRRSPSTDSEERRLRREARRADRKARKKAEKAERKAAETSEGGDAGAD